MDTKKKIIPFPDYSIKPGDTIFVPKKKVVDMFNITFNNNKKLIKDLGKY